MIKNNSQKLFLGLLVLLVSACNNPFRKKCIQPIPQEILQTQEQALVQSVPCDITQFDYVCPEERQNYNESLDAFVLNEEDNRFNQTKEAESQDLKLAPAEQLGDAYRDSAVHGLKTIYYDFGEHAVKKDQQATLENNYAVVKGLADKGYTIVCEGHACNSYGSSDARNITISEERPQYIADYFIAKGVNSKKLKVVGRGAEMKIVPHGDRIQQAPNRRVEFYAYPPATA
ncbi:MAG: OmpA family protein [Candidatus Amoebophilus sp.]